MDYRELKIPGAYEVTPRQFGDDRGLFLEWFKQSSFTDAAGRPLSLAQANCSVSARGVLRGIHYADVPPGQAKYITCLTGAVLDVVVDLRVGSQTFGQWDSVLLDTEHRRAVFLSEGLGHGFVALEEGSTVVYLCSTEYNPEREHEIDPFDAEIGIDWPTVGTDGSALTFELSAKDQAAPGLASARDAGALPTYHV
ncbi:dTDP-4-dehydrorhamnose 3,5-epimerase family protein [Prescottella equi]|uniref:dTDP-4-dehydrorhamnose 3,5-epimerase family protein n=1 Tax=Rhodococcus hoagii TaxID=43767 RepID=UPI0011A93CEB|nr:dTDP-4-dehydrorhamnose 3,5-epimerase [Prescottella equi]